MSRSSLNSAARTQLASASVRFACMIDIAFTGGNIRSTTGAMAITLSGNVYSPDGFLTDIKGVEERAGSPARVEITVPAVGDMKTRVEAGGYRRVQVDIHFVVIDDDMSVIQALSSQYRINKIALTASPNTHSYIIYCSSVMDDAGRAHPVYPSDAAQQLRYAGDTYFAGSSAVRTYEFEWGGISYHGGGGGCVAIETVINGRRADSYKAGDTITVCDPETFEETEATILYSQTKEMPCVLIETDTGRQLICSTSAPIATDSGQIRAPHLLHYAIPIKDGAIDYERIVKVKKLGLRRVQHIDIGGKCFWADGFLHHNKMKILTGQTPSTIKSFTDRIGRQIP